MQISRQSPITSPRALFALVATGILIFAVATIMLGRAGMRTIQDAALEEAVTIRTRGAEIAFARAREQEWQRLQAIARALGTPAATEVDLMLVDPNGAIATSRNLPGVLDDLPSFGWRLVGRVQSEDFPLTPEYDLVWSATTALLVAGAAYLLLTFVFTRLYLRPIAALAGTADRMAEGHETDPL